MLEKVKNGVVSRVVNGVLDAVFPTACVGCGREGQYICTRCENFFNETAPICPVCQHSSFSGERHEDCTSRYSLDGFVSCWEYEGVVKSLLHDIKYNGITHAAKETTQRVSILMMRDVHRFQPFLSFLSFPETFIAYVPMYRKKERQRGFNQAAVFAKELAVIAKRQVVPLLEKIRDTKPQIDLGKEERLLNVRGAFAPFAQPDFMGVRNIVLVDDVWTTGATMKECCQVLKKAGVQKVWGFTIARTP